MTFEDPQSGASGRSRPKPATVRMTALHRTIRLVKGEPFRAPLNETATTSLIDPTVLQTAIFVERSAIAFRDLRERSEASDS